MTQLANRLPKLFGFAALMACAGVPQVPSAPEVGDKVPDFSLQASDGKTYTLSQFKGVRPVVLAFFPKAFTGG